MRTLRISMAILLLIALTPVLLALLAIVLANTHGCTLHEGFTNPCVILGADWGHALYTMVVLHWFGIVTLPFAALLSLVWIVIEVALFVRRQSRTR